MKRITLLFVMFFVIGASGTLNAASIYTNFNGTQDDVNFDNVYRGTFTLGSEPFTATFNNVWLSRGTAYDELNLFPPNLLYIEATYKNITF